jgi:hypothetical protein
MNKTERLAKRYVFLSIFFNKMYLIRYPFFHGSPFLFFEGIRIPNLLRTILLK